MRSMSEYKIYKEMDLTSPSCAGAEGELDSVLEDLGKRRSCKGYN